MQMIGQPHLSIHFVSGRAARLSATAVVMQRHTDFAARAGLVMGRLWDDRVFSDTGGELSIMYCEDRHELVDYARQLCEIAV
jgi:hypothetical protein